MKPLIEKLKAEGVPMRGYFGIGIYHGKKEQNIGTLMRSAYAFGAHFCFTIGRRYQRQSSDTVNAVKHVPIYHFDSVQEMKGGLPIGCRVVGVELHDSAFQLHKYVHPEQCIYLLGAEDHGLTSEAIEVCHEIIQIPFASRCLNVATAGSIVMYDRFVSAKSCRSQTSLLET